MTCWVTIIHIDRLIATGSNRGERYITQRWKRNCSGYIVCKSLVIYYIENVLHKSFITTISKLKSMYVLVIFWFSIVFGLLQKIRSSQQWPILRMSTRHVILTKLLFSLTIECFNKERYSAWILKVKLKISANNSNDYWIYSLCFRVQRNQSAVST